MVNIILQNQVIHVLLISLLIISLVLLLNKVVHYLYDLLINIIRSMWS